MPTSTIRTLLLAAALGGAATRAEAQRALTPFPLSAALRVVADSTPRRAAVDSTVRDSAAAAAPARRPIGFRPSRSPKLFYGALASGLIAVRAFHLDSDPGGYADGFRTETMFPDKGVHALASWALVNAGTDLKVSPWRAAAVVSVVGVGYEYAQGYVSKYDIAADVVGAVSAAAWRTWRSHANAR